MGKLAGNTIFAKRSNPHQSRFDTKKLFNLIDQKHGRMIEFARYLGYTSSSTVSLWRDRKTVPAVYVEKILKFMNSVSAGDKRKRA